MGKGDRKTAKGKRYNASYGNARSHTASKVAVGAAASSTGITAQCNAHSIEPVAPKRSSRWRRREDRDMTSSRVGESLWNNITSLSEPHGFPSPCPLDGIRAPCD